VRHMVCAWLMSMPPARFSVDAMMIPKIDGRPPRR
jgi:hypothetical protein